MKGESKLVLVLALIGITLACSFAILRTSPQKTTGTIDMVQPCASFWCMAWDAHYAGNVNLPNSQANENNSQARLNDAQAELLQAQAQDANSVAWQFAQIGLMGGCLWGFLIVLAGCFVFVFFVRK
jgi:hypothetical protein